jgi:hypothetical protein
VAQRVGACIRRCFQLERQFSECIFRAKKTCDCDGDWRKELFSLARFGLAKSVRLCYVTVNAYSIPSWQRHPALP